MNETSLGHKIQELYGRFKEDKETKIALEALGKPLEEKSASVFFPNGLEHPPLYFWKALRNF